MKAPIKGVEAEEAVAEIRALADKWYAATDIGTGEPSVIARAFAQELYRVLGGQ